MLLEKTLESPWTARSSNQSILKEISPEYSLEGLMLKLKLQYFGHLIRRTDWLEKDPDAGKDWRQERKGTTEDDGWMASPTRWTWVWVSSRRWWWIGKGKPGMLQSLGLQRLGHAWAPELNWTTRHQALVLGTWNMSMNKTKIPTLKSITSLWVEID